MDMAVAAPLNLLTTRQAGERLGLAGGYVGQLVNAGKLVPFAYSGTQRNALFLAEAIEAYAAERAEWDRLERDRLSLYALSRSANP
jgi:hypothetical protein